MFNYYRLVSKPSSDGFSDEEEDADAPGDFGPHAHKFLDADDDNSDDDDDNSDAGAAEDALARDFWGLRSVTENLTCHHRWTKR